MSKIFQTFMFLLCNSYFGLLFLKWKTEISKTLISTHSDLIDSLFRGGDVAGKVGGGFLCFHEWIK